MSRYTYFNMFVNFYYKCNYFSVDFKNKGFSFFFYRNQQVITNYIESNSKISISTHSISMHQIVNTFLPSKTQPKRDFLIDSTQKTAQNRSCLSLESTSACFASCIPCLWEPGNILPGHRDTIGYRFINQSDVCGTPSLTLSSFGCIRQARFAWGGSSGYYKLVVYTRRLLKLTKYYLLYLNKSINFILY